jgi:hypothetical protein
MFTRLIGDAAKNQLTTNPENTIFDAKRLIGRDWSDKHVQNDIKFFPFKVVEKNAKPHVQVKNYYLIILLGLTPVFSIRIALILACWIRIRIPNADADPGVQN